MKKIQNVGKSIQKQMGMAYMGRFVMIHRIQRKINFDFTTYGSRVIEENVKWSDIAPP